MSLWVKKIKSLQSITSNEVVKSSAFESSAWIAPNLNWWNFYFSLGMWGSRIKQNVFSSNVLSYGA